MSTFILPRLSERVAQNERTLFTFLSAEGKTTLPAFLSDYRDDFNLLTPDRIYDYFEPIFRQELHAGEIHKIFLLAERILSQMEPTMLAAKIIKTIARTFDELTGKNFIVYLRQSNN